MGRALGAVFLGRDLLSSFVVAVVSVQRSSVQRMVSPSACPQSFAIEGIPYLYPSLCGLWHGKQAVPPFLLVFLQEFWRRRTVSGTVPCKASLPPVCRFICHGVVLVVEMCVLECLEELRVQEGLWREDRAGVLGDGEPGP